MTGERARAREGTRLATHDRDPNSLHSTRMQAQLGLLKHEPTDKYLQAAQAGATPSHRTGTENTNTKSKERGFVNNCSVLGPRQPGPSAVRGLNSPLRALHCWHARPLASGSRWMMCLPSVDEGLMFFVGVGKKKTGDVRAAGGKERGGREGGGGGEDGGGARVDQRADISELAPALRVGRTSSPPSEGSPRAPPLPPATPARSEPPRAHGPPPPAPAEQGTRRRLARRPQPPPSIRGAPLSRIPSRVHSARTSPSSRGKAVAICHGS